MNQCLEPDARVQSDHEAYCLSLEVLRDCTTALAGQRDSRIRLSVGSMLVAGTSVGAMLSATPKTVLQRGLSQVQFRCLMPTFGLVKVLANLPA